jgi:probable rRNA maturation factor
MFKIEPSVQVDPEFEARVDQHHLIDVIRHTLELEGKSGPSTVGLLITDDNNIRRLNLEYRGEDRTTDVLAFDMTDGSDGFVSPPSVPPHLGEVVVSYPRALAQATEYGHSEEEELDRLVIHGMLHLLGYDDHSLRDREVMWAKQEAAVRDFHARER